jgi:hypothetical protein
VASGACELESASRDGALASITIFGAIAQTTVTQSPDTGMRI